MAPAVVQENLIVTLFLNVPLAGEIVGVSTVADGVGVGVGVTEGVGVGVDPATKETSFDGGPSTRPLL